MVLVSIHPSPSPQSVPLATAFLKSYAAGCGVEVILIDFFLDHSVEGCAAEIAASSPAAVGFSVYVWNRARSAEIAAELRRTCPGVHLFAGGPEVTADPQGILATGVFDFIIQGEGEIPFRVCIELLAAGKSVAGIPGVILPDFPLDRQAAPCADLAHLPSPYLDGTLDACCYSGLLWQLSRGCGFSCDFCFDSRSEKGVRRFPLERLRKELHLFATSGVSQIFVLDSTFNQDADRAKAILRMIHTTAPQIHFHFEVRSEFIDHEMAELFACIPCSLQIGLQSSDSAVLATVGRIFKKNDFTRKVGLLNESGAIFGFDLIYGLPGDSLNGFRNSIDFALSLYPNHLDIFPLAVLPGTRLSKNGCGLGLHWEQCPPYRLISSETFSAEDMKAAGKLAAACDIFYTRGRAVAWFNSVLYVLNDKPSRFLESFSAWMASDFGGELSEATYDDAAVYDLQRAFLQHKFSSKPFRKLLPLVEDLLKYHYLYASALLSQPIQSSPESITETMLLERRLKLSSSAVIVYFNYNIDEILECGAPDIRWMVETLVPVGSAAVIYSFDGRIFTESLDPGYAELLEKLDDSPRLEPLIAVCGLPLDETIRFLAVAYQEGIITDRESTK
ncbi:MAG: cobalamin-dependent protein [Desulfuromonadales bacterium]